jgi:hypothetical protein
VTVMNRGRNPYDPSTHTIGTDKVNPDPHGLMQAKRAHQFGSPDEAIAAVERGIKLLKARQIEFRQLAAIMRDALPVIENGRESLWNFVNRPYIDPRGGR